MLKRHVVELQNALDPLAYRRFVTLSRRQFRYWVGVQRIRTTAWDTLVQHLPEDVDAEDINVVEDDDDILLFYRDKMSKLQ